MMSTATDETLVTTPAEPEVTLKKKPLIVWSEGKKAPPEVIARALRSLTMILSVGGAEAEALSIVGDQFKKYTIGRAFVAASDAMTLEGASMKQALLAEKVLPRNVKQLIGAAQTSTALRENLREAAKIVTESESVRKKLMMNMIQPGLMLGMTIIFLFVSTIVIIPQFATIFDSFGAETPASMLIMVAIADVAKWFIGALIMALLLFAGFWVFYGRRSPRFRTLMDKVLVRVPIVGSILKYSASSRLFQLLAVNLELGLNEPEALVSAASGCGNDALREHCEKHAHSMIENGDKLTDFVRTPLIPEAGAHVIATSPTVQQAINVMREISPEYEEESKMQLESFSRTVDPIVNYVVIGVASVIILMIALPMFDIYTAMMDYGDTAA